MSKEKEDMIARAEEVAKDLASLQAKVAILQADIHMLKLIDKILESNK